MVEPSRLAINKNVRYIFWDIDIHKINILGLMKKKVCKYTRK